MEFNEFKDYCLNGICNRNTFISNRCKIENKISKCYKKYERQIEKNKEKKEKQILKDIEKIQEKLTKIQKEFNIKKEKYLNSEIEDLYGFNDKIDLEWERIKKIVTERDKKCIIWNHILLKEEKLYILKNFWKEYSQLCSTFDHAHIESIARRPDLKYNENNIVLISRFFHNRLDQYRNLSSNEKITEDQRNLYLKKLKEYIYYINKENDKNENI